VRAEYLLIPDSRMVAAGGMMEVSLLVANDSSEKVDAASSARAPDDRDTARFVTAFSQYEPNYFSAGSNGPTNAKFQVSLKFRLFNPDTQTRFLDKLYIAYSQTSIWAIA
jgi:outer membrane phospholipase A